MSLPRISEKAFVIGEPELKYTPAGKAVVRVPLAFSKQRKQDDGSWERTHELVVNGTAWEAFAENIANTIQAKTQVLVSGEIFVRKYQKKDGTDGQSVDMNIWEIAPCVDKRGEQSSRPSQPYEGQSGGGFGSQESVPF